MSYSDLLKDPRWQKKRLEVLQSREWRCSVCVRTDKTLHVHHKHYRYGAMPWEYENCELEVLCEECHDELTAAAKLLKSILAVASPGLVFQVVAYAVASAPKMDGMKMDLLRVYHESQVTALADSMRDAETYGLPVGRTGIYSRIVDGKIDVVSLAKEESDAMDACIARMHQQEKVGEK